MRASPVPRAGWLAVALLPAFLALPAAVARCWVAPEARRRGALAVAMVAGAVGVLALAGALWQGSPRAAQPLGNAVALGAFLAMVTPLALAATMAERGRWRWAAAAALALALLGLLATRSVAGLAALVVGAAVALPRGRRRWLLVPLLAGLVLLGPRLVRIAAGRDASVHARTSYWGGGLRGIAARPLLGWGPGGTAWTLAPHVGRAREPTRRARCRPTCTACRCSLLYELGLPGLAAAGALAVAFVLARWREGSPRRRGGAAARRPRAACAPGGGARGGPDPGHHGALGGPGDRGGGGPGRRRAPLATAVRLRGAWALRPSVGSTPPSRSCCSRRSTPPSPATTQRAGAPARASALVGRARRRARSRACRSTGRGSGWLAASAARGGWSSPAPPPARREWRRCSSRPAGRRRSPASGGESCLARACEADPLLGAAPSCSPSARPGRRGRRRLARAGHPRRPAAARRDRLRRPPGAPCSRARRPEPLAVIDFEGPPQFRPPRSRGGALGGVDAGLRQAILDAGAAVAAAAPGPVGRRGIAMDGEPDTRHLAVCLPPSALAADARLRGRALPEAKALSAIRGAGWLRTTRRARCRGRAWSRRRRPR